MIRSFLLTCTLLFLTSFASAQFQFPAVDLEVGNTYNLTQDLSYPYAMARLNIPIGPEILNGQAFILPEAAVFLTEQTGYWLRAQFVVDFPGNTVFLDAQTSPLLGTQVRYGIRFGF